MSSVPLRSAILVLGMHRSGTSALTGLLQKLGVDGPENPQGPSKHNSLGFFESRPLYLLQDELLASAGTNWYDYRPFPANWLTSPKADEFCDRMKALLEAEYSSSRFLVIKDPRNCRLVPFWHRVFLELKIQPLHVHTHRNPLEVAQSLQKRNGFDPDYGCLLWLRHILEAEAASRGQIRSFTSYNCLLQNWPLEIEKIASDLDITWPKYNAAQMSGLSAMIRPDLKHNDFKDLIGSQLFSQRFRETFEIFNRWAKKGERSKDHTRLDQIRQGFDESVTVFEGVVHNKSKVLTAERDQACTKAKELGKLSAEREAAIQTLTAERDQARAQSKELGALSAEREAAIRTLTAERDQARTKAKELGTLSAEREAAVQALSVERDQARYKAKELEALSAEREAAVQALTTERDSLVSEQIFDRSMLEQRKAEIDDTLRELENTQSALAAAETERRSLAIELEQANERISLLHGTETRRNEDLAKLQRMVVRYQNEIETIRTKAVRESVRSVKPTQSSSKFKEPDEELSEYDTLNSQTIIRAGTLQELNEQIAQSEARIQELLSSTSWRLTAPLRWIVLRFRK